MFCVLILTTRALTNGLFINNLLWCCKNRCQLKQADRLGGWGVLVFYAFHQCERRKIKLISRCQETERSPLEKGCGGVRVCVCSRAWDVLVWLICNFIGHHRSRSSSSPCSHLWIAVFISAIEERLLRKVYKIEASGRKPFHVIVI